MNAGTADQSVHQSASREASPDGAGLSGAGRSDAETHVKDTIESILVAFILAFIFRAFVVEAFVIPTGSMAPTLLGAHMRVACADCGYAFDVNYSSERTNSEDVIIESHYKGRLKELYCPNCGYHIPDQKPGDPAFQPAVRYGDRILVQKYAYLLQEPGRWDVVVFKSPAEPETHDYTQNYIKRLIGRPNEAVMILDGDVYAGASDADRRDLRVQTKPRPVQEAMWRLVHDNDYLPRGVDRDPNPGDRVRHPTWKQPWTPEPGGRGWTVDGAANPAGGGRRFSFDNAGGGASLAFDAEANSATHALTDWTIYDQADTWTSEIMPVSDLKLKLAYLRKTGDGALRLALSKYGRTFVAEIGPSTARLLESDGRSEKEIVAPRPIGGSAGSELSIEFQNVDYCVSLRINDVELFRTGPDQYAPAIDELLGANGAAGSPGTVTISAENQACEVRHVSLWRDVYYLNESRRDPTVFWASPDKIMRLGADEYFVLGDNSLKSEDARYWGPSTAIDLPAEHLAADPGRIPGRFLLGKACFVYWPAGYRPFGAAPALVPNFGDMRFIH